MSINFLMRQNMKTNTIITFLVLFLIALNLTSEDKWQKYPLLPIVFFDSNSCDIPQKYIRLNNEQSASFNIDEIIKTQELNTMSVYYYLLNIIGYRMKLNPDA